MVKGKCYQERVLSNEAGYLRPRPAGHHPEHGRKRAGKGPPRSHIPRHSKTLELYKWVGVPLGHACLLCFFFCNPQDESNLAFEDKYSSDSESSQGQIQAILCRGAGHSSLERKKAQPSPLSIAQPRSPGPGRGTSE